MSSLSISAQHQTPTCRASHSAGCRSLLHEPWFPSWFLLLGRFHSFTIPALLSNKPMNGDGGAPRVANIRRRWAGVSGASTTYHGGEMTDEWTYRNQNQLGYDPTSGRDLTGYSVEALDGSIGKIDEANNDVGASYLIVDTGPWIFGKKVMLPAGVVQRVDEDDEKVWVNRTKERSRTHRSLTSPRSLLPGIGSRSVATTALAAAAIATGTTSS